MTGKVFEWEVNVDLRPDEQVKAIDAEESRAGESTRTVVADDWRPAELTEWIKASAQLPRTFASTMSASSIGAIPIYLALLKFLGTDHASKGLWAVSALPPILWLAAALVFVFALRPTNPTFANSLDEFANLRSQRLSQIGHLNDLGTIIFGSAMVVAMAIALVLLWA